MAEYRYKKGDEEFGPISAKELKRLASKGTITGDDLVGRDGPDPKWRKASSIKDLFPESSQSPPPPPPIDAGPGAPVTKTKSQQIAEGLKVAGALAGKQASLKASQLKDLPAADSAIGKKAHALGIGSEQYSDLYDQIKEIEQKVQTLRKPEAATEHETMGDRAKRAAGGVKKKAQAEVLLRNRNKCLQTLGTSLRENGSDAAELTEELTNARAVVEKISSLEGDIASLSKQAPFLTRGRVIAAGIAAALIAGFIFFPRGPGSSDLDISSQTAEASQALATFQEDAAREQARIEKEIAELDRQMKQDELEDAARDKLEAARNKLKQEQQIAEATRKKRQRELENAKADAERQADSNIRMAQEQIDRKDLAARLFKTVELDPKSNVALSRTIKQISNGLELRGQGYNEIVEFYDSQDWLGLVNFLLGQEFEELPVATQIENAFSRLKRKKFVMFLKTNEVIPDRGEQRLGLITINRYPDDRYATVIHARYNSWERHPDGTGYVHDWTPNYGRAVIVVGSGRDMQQKCSRLNNVFRETAKGAHAKFELGEIDKATKERELSNAAEMVFKEAVKWASSL